MWFMNTTKIIELTIPDVMANLSEYYLQLEWESNIAMKMDFSSIAQTLHSVWNKTLGCQIRKN